MKAGLRTMLWDVFGHDSALQVRSIIVKKKSKYFCGANHLLLKSMSK